MPFHGPTDWMVKAACAGRADDLWNDSDEGLAGQMRATYARRICIVRCLVREECLAYAFENKINHGVWGGLTQDDRRAYRRSLEPSGRTISPMPPSTRPPAKTPPHSRPASSSPPNPKPKNTKPTPKAHPAVDEPETHRPFLAVGVSDLDRLSVLRQLNPTDPGARTRGFTPEEWYAKVRFEGTKEEFLTWLAAVTRAGALHARDGGRVAIP